MTEISDKAVEAAITAFNEACSSPVMVNCKRCAGKGYHHGFGEDGASPDCCSDCGGGGYELADGEDRRPFRAALSAALPHLGAAGVAVPGWQPMETAPKDGNEILGIQIHSGRPSDPGIVRWDDFEREWWDIDADQYGYPTHWMPLPGSALVPSPVPQEAAAEPVSALVAEFERMRDKHSRPCGTQYEEGQWDMAQRLIGIARTFPAPSALVAEPAAEPCTCHPDDNPPRPCPQKYALSECKKAAAALVAEPGEPVATKPAFWAVHSPTGMHIGLWNDRATAEKVRGEHFGNVLTPLFAAPPARQDGALREAREAINHALMALPLPSAASQRRAWAGLIDVRDNLDAALAQSAAPVQPEPAMRETMWGEVVDDDYEGIAFRLTEEGNRDGHHFLKEIALAAETFPLGTKITVAEPVQQAAPSGEGE